MSDRYRTPAATEPRPHGISITYLVMGLAFLGLFALWALGQSDLAPGLHVRWLLPTPWLVAGAVGLGVAWARRRR